MSNIIASKIVFLDTGVLEVTIPAAVFVFPVTFLVTDTINEIWGKQKAREIIWIGFIMNLVMVIFLYLGQLLPPAPFWEGQEAYEKILGAVPRMVAASMAAYIFSQLHDVWAFHYWKRFTRGRHLWLRNNLSTISSQLIDTVIFITIAFAFVEPWSEVMMLIIYQYLVKLIIAAVDTPLCYLLVGWIRKREEGMGVDG